MSQLLNLAQSVVKDSLAEGADEASVSVSHASYTTLVRRGGKVEQATQSTTRGLVVSLLVEDRYSSHSTSDLRPEALRTFLRRALNATGYLEQDPDRRLPDAALCGRGATAEQLDQRDPSWDARKAEDRADLAETVERLMAENEPDGVISSASYVADGASESAWVMSNGFSDEHRGAWFSVGGEMTLLDTDGRRPEASAYYGSRYLSDIPAPEEVALEVVTRAKERLGSRAIASGTYPMLLQNRSVSRILGALGGPLSGSALHHGRSCLTGRLGERLGSPLFTLLDDPTIARGLGSRPWDGDGLVAVPRAIFEEGVLKSYYINVYYGRRLGVDPTTGSLSNWVVPPGDQSVEDLAKALPKAILVNGFLGGNSNGVTGDFSFGVRGVLLEYGEPVQSLSEMNVSGNLLTIFDRLGAIADDPWPYSSVRSPTLLFDDVQFSGS
ncbi:MAG: TldD/PmbA family protein [Deltaproteobacteria bacterium]|nr:TldD/PmbA family protein [Deltaproteobacteria bacterium]MBW2254199.1 TldD/PmbA family protein [Deltaproteobacteria bacterium]